MQLDKEKNALFKVGTKVSVLGKWLKVGVLEIWSQISIVVEFRRKKTKKGDPSDEYVVVSVREAVKGLSVDHGQGYLKCSCQSM